MKKYVFVNGDVEAENLDAETIKKYEGKLGELLGVFSKRGYTPVYNDVIKVSYNGELHTIKEWAKILDINESTLRSRYSKGEHNDILFRRVGT